MSITGSWYDITYACGHTVSTKIYGLNRKDKDWKADHRSDLLCPNCWRKEQEEEKKRIHKAGVLENKKAGFSDLSGTPKQIKWAEDIRSQVRNAQNDIREEVVRHFPPNCMRKALEFHDKIMADFFSHDEAKWLIEHRSWFGDKNDRLQTSSFNADLPADMRCLYWKTISGKMEELKPEDLLVPHETNLKENIEANLPELSGSEEEIGQAEDIRAQINRNQVWFLNIIFEFIKVPEKKQFYKEAHEKVMKTYLSHTNASWYIENKDWFGQDNNGGKTTDLPYMAAIKAEALANYPSLLFLFADPRKKG